MTVHFHNGSDYRGAVGNEGAPTGLRERKKARTRTAIQRHALRLFGEQGYQATTVEQVAAAAEVSMSTVFRYFPTKEDLLVLDGYHSLATSVAEAFRRQPADLGPVGALRGALGWPSPGCPRRTARRAGSATCWCCGCRAAVGQPRPARPHPGPGGRAGRRPHRPRPR
jgi:hypothetical protein